MGGTLARPRLLVEGADDRHALIHLLLRHGVELDLKDAPPRYPVVQEMGGDDGVLAQMEDEIKASTRRAVGFVLDADESLLSRWEQVRHRLSNVGVGTPGQPLPEGFIGHSEKYEAHVGVWIMPDNQSDGKLEDFLRSLVQEGDRLIGHAEAATDGAAAIEQRFSEPDRIKAIVHAWLAWQEEPGRPYGTAMKAHYFQHDAALALRFVAWFKKLYGIA